MTRIYVPTKGPENWQSLLAHPEKHWKSGYSARTMAFSWEEADGLPREIAALFEGIDTVPELLIALPEFKTPLPGGDRDSQTDVLAIVRTAKGNITCAVEGKVDEPFGPLLGDWLKEASPGKQQRLDYICECLGITNPAMDTHYQLMHRAASAVIQAERFSSWAAAMIVHSFSPKSMWFGAFAKFVQSLGKEVLPGDFAPIVLPSGRPLFLGWAKGDPRYLRS